MWHVAFLAYPLGWFASNRELRLPCCAPLTCARERCSGTRPSCSPRFANRNNFVALTVRVDASGPFKGLPLLQVDYHVRAGTAPVDGAPDTSEFTVTLPPLLTGKAGTVADQLQTQFMAPLLPPKPGILSKITCGALG